MEDFTVLGRRIQELRKAKGWTQPQLAVALAKMEGTKVTGSSKARLSEFENGKKPPLPMVERLDRVFESGQELHDLYVRALTGGRLPADPAALDPGIQVTTYGPAALARMELTGTANSVTSLFERLSREVAQRHAALQRAEVDVLFTDSGVCLRVGRRRPLTAVHLVTLTKLAFEIASAMRSADLPIHIVLHAAEADKELATVVASGDHPYSTTSLAFDARRFVAYCGDDELLLTHAFQVLMKAVGAESPFTTRSLLPIMTRDSRVEEVASIAIGPAARSDEDKLDHAVRQLAGLPKLSKAAVDGFRDAGLADALADTLQAVADAPSLSETSRTIMLRRDVMSLLTRPDGYDPRDEVCVVSRNDHPGFWEQHRRDAYLSFLRAQAKAHGTINQRRIWVFPDDEEYELDGDDLLSELIDLHASGTFVSLPRSRLSHYPQLSTLPYGCTVSRRHHYAIFPMAPSAPESFRFGAASLTALFANAPSYNPVDGPMRAVATTNEHFVDDLLSDFDAAFASPYRSTLK